MTKCESRGKKRNSELGDPSGRSNTEVFVLNFTVRSKFHPYTQVRVQ